MPNNLTNQPMYLGPSGDPETFNEPTLLYPGQLGSKFTLQPQGGPQRGKTYQLVHTDSTMTVAPFSGATAWWADKAAFKVTTSPTALGRGAVAGVFRTAVVPGRYCFIQTKGLSPAVKFIDLVTSAPDATGKFVIPSATAGKADCLTAGTAATYPQLGRSASAYNAADATADVDLDVPEYSV